MIKVKPFVKWAGGKRQILDKLKSFMPDEYNTYYEPFIGGGALFFEIKPKRAVINDLNNELMNVFNVLCNDKSYNKMCRLLNKYERKHSEEFYYKLRDLDKDKNKFNKKKDYFHAARTIYLNKACFNGLYRVNSKGEFNVPFGKKSKVNSYDIENLMNVHSYLTMNNITIMSKDFEECISTCKEGDFVYFDPPYDSDNNIFNNYTESGFGKKEQERLAKAFKELDTKKVKIMLSNHNTSLINKLYKDYNINVIEAKRSINSNGKKRGTVEEVIITNY